MFVSDFYATQEGKDYLKLAFSKNFSHQAVVINGNLVSMGDGGFIEIDKYNEYKINQFGFRENEFNSDSIDILAVGCSFTFGVGVPNNCAWPRMFDNQYKTINLGSPGISAETILMNTLKYINLFGKPKNIISLFPDPYRLCFIHDKNFHVSKYLPLDKTVYPTDKELNNLKLGSHEDSIIIKQKYLKLPFELNDFISPHFAIYKTIQSIYILQEFCKQNNINFVWSTWNHNFSKLLNYSFESDKDFMLDKNNYIHFGQGSILEDKTCNDDHGSEFKNHQCWNQGSDISIHPGIHYQIHVYELFKDRIIK